MSESSLKLMFNAALRGLRRTVLARSFPATSYRAAREEAFRLKMLAELHHHWDHERFDQIKAISKSIEDALGGYQDLAELPDWFKKHHRIFPLPSAALKKRLAREIERDRREGLVKLRQWLTDQGWSGSGTQFRKLSESLQKIKWPSDAEAHANTGRHTAKFLRNLQSDIENGKYSPKDGFYTREEYASRVHQLRIDIRRLGQFTAFSKGDFRIVQEASPGTSAFPEFYFLKNTEAGESKFARLPYKSKPSAFPIPESVQSAVNFFVAELDTAKSFALSASRVCTVAERISSRRMNPEAIVRSYPAMNYGTDRTTDQIARDIIGKIKRSNLFGKTAGLFK